jgi:hypothetical protein
MNIELPPAALEAGARQICGYERDQDVDWREYIGHARAAFLAMLQAWPGMAHYRGGWEPVVHNNRKPHIILPLTEASDAE